MSIFHFTYQRERAILCVKSVVGKIYLKPASLHSRKSVIVWGQLFIRLY